MTATESQTSVSKAIPLSPPSAIARNETTRRARGRPAHRGLQLARDSLSEASRERIHQAVGAIQALLLDAAVVTPLGGSRSASVAGAAALAVRLVELLEVEAAPAIAEGR